MTDLMQGREVAPVSHDAGRSDDAAVRFEDVHKVFVTGDGTRVRALEGLNLSVARGEMLAIVGQTGCGKSTAFNLLLGLFGATSGTVTVHGMDPHRDFEALKGRIAVVFQDGRLLPWRTAEDNAALGLEYQGVRKAERTRIAREWLARLGLEGREKAYPFELSGGMRQRVGIARCFALNPDIILCDESFSALDELTAERLRGEFLRLVKNEGKTGVFITHSIEEALTVGDRVAVFRAPGHVAAEFTPEAALSESELSRMRKSVRDVMAGVESPGSA
ncbi:ABC transporter ATP-binding protein [Phytoactinopolyspora limicola]|uniref:ABC transporter ATP-binding protein n=1 Tax=Phytoactinopolyspora limicola TaxID=2715536 RepID=UPI0014089CA4|nr:ABC transporter ATP-binding protein [Phytoactinopolyspora limicola]